MAFDVREYQQGDEEAWLQLRVLAFLHTAYFDDVYQSRPDCHAPGFGVVAEVASEVIGILDVTIEDDLATIDTVAVHPDRQSQGCASAMLAEALTRAAAAGATAIDAWTRDDEAALRWYRARGFRESDHYLHVYANLYTDPAEPGRAVASPGPGLRPVIVFSHASIGDEERLRREFQRVHVCRRFLRPLIS